MEECHENTLVHYVANTVVEKLLTVYHLPLPTSPSWLLCGDMCREDCAISGRRHLVCNQCFQKCLLPVLRSPVKNISTEPLLTSIVECV